MNFGRQMHLLQYWRSTGHLHCWLSKGKKKLTESIPGEAHTLGVLDQGFSCAPVAKDDNKGRNKGNQNDEQAENTSEEVEITKSDQIETEK